MNSGVGRIFARGIVGVLSLVLVSTLVPGTAAQAKSHPVVPMELFGVHYHGISNSQPNFRVGAIRLWDSGVTWAALNPAQGVYEWGALDRAVDNARNAGALEVQYVFGVTPQWAAAKPALKGFYGLGVVPPGEHGLLHGLRDCHGAAVPGSDHVLRGLE